MENYYRKILEEIKDLLESQKWDKARDLIQGELKMPYIPFDVEVQLTQWWNEIKGNSLKKTNNGLGLDEIEQYLNGTKQQQLMAVDALDSMNLRAHIEIIQDYLENGTYLPASRLLIDSCIRQQLDTEMLINIQGEKYSFVPSQCVTIDKSAGFLEALMLLEKWIQGKEPSLFELCKTILFQYCFEHLPWSYSKQEGRILAFSAIYHVMHDMDRIEDWEEIFAMHQIESDQKSEIIEFYDEKSFKKG